MSGPEDFTRRAPPSGVVVRPMAIAGVVLLAILAFVPSIGNGFALDDALARATNDDGTPNAPIAELHGPGFYFTSDYWEGFGVRSGLYRPVTILSFALTYHLFGQRGSAEALPHHVINVLLHGLATYLVLWLMLDLGLTAGAALLAAALFAVHAVHSEVVATVIGRGELLAFCFGMLGLWLLRKSQSARPIVWLPLSGLALFLSFGSKESAVAWAPFAVLYAWWRGGTVGRPLIAVLPALVLFLVLRQLVVSTGEVEPARYVANPLAFVDPVARVLTGIKLIGYGLLLCVAPFSLVSLYGSPSIEVIHSPLDLAFVASTIVIVAWLGAAWRLRRSTPNLLIAAAIFFGFSFITSNIPFAIGTIFGERLYYAPSLGVCLLPALWMTKLLPRGKRILIGAACVWIAGNLYVDVQRSFAWRDNETLFIADSEAHQDCALLQQTAARMFHVLSYARPERKAEFRQRARAAMWRARELDPDYHDTYALEAELLERQGLIDGAIEALQKALALRRLDESGLEPSLRRNLGRLLIAGQNQVADGLREFQRSLDLNPADIALRLQILKVGRPILPRAEMVRLIEEGLKLHPGDAELLEWSRRVQR